MSEKMWYGLLTAQKECNPKEPIALLQTQRKIHFSKTSAILIVFLILNG